MAEKNIRPGIIKNSAVCISMLTAATGIGYLFQMNHLLDTNIVMTYMIGVLLTASLTDGYLYGIVEALLALGAYNYFFVTPYFSMDVDNPSYLFSILIMLLASVLTSMLTSKVRYNEKRAREREAEAAELLQWTNRIAEARCIGDIAFHIVKNTGTMLGCRISCMIADDDGNLYGSYLCQTGADQLAWIPLLEREALNKAFHDADEPKYHDSAFYRDCPIYGRSGLLGALRIPMEEVALMEAAQLRMFASVKETAHLAMDRIYALKHQIKDNAIAERERDRATILRSISHDLRTPLAGIMGTSEMLLDMTEKASKRRLLEDIRQDAQWLYEMVENVLSLTRIQDGKLIHKEPEAFEEVIEAAVRRIQGRAQKRKIQIRLPGECLVVSMDIRLIEQVIINMLDNAITHTAEDGEIFVSLEKQEGEAVFEIKDNGTGIQEGELPYIFQLFYTSKGINSDKKKGVGLGLAICEAVIRAHNGNISAGNRKDTAGAVFRFTIPMEEY